MIATIKHKEVDHIPLYFRSHDFRPPAELSWKDQYERAEKWLSVGVDDILFVQSALTRNDYCLGQGDPIEFVQGVKTKVSVTHDEKEEYPVIAKEYTTPEGMLRQEVRKTEDWDSNNNLAYDHGGDNLLLFDDYNVSRSRKFLIERESDLKNLKYLFSSPSKGILNQYQGYVDEVKRKANQLGVLHTACTSTGIDTLIWLCGLENTIFMSYDKPDMFEQLIEIVHQRDILATEICLDSGVDMIFRRGWYEGCNLWSPAIYRRYFLPKVKEIAKLVREGNRLFGYALPYGMMPILPDLLDIGYDVHWYVDDIQGDADFKKVKELFSGKVAILGGVNEAITLEREPIDVIKKSVYRAVELLGREGGFVLSPTDGLYSSTPWKSVKAVIDARNEITHRKIVTPGD